MSAKRLTLLSTLCCCSQTQGIMASTFTGNTIIT